MVLRTLSLTVHLVAVVLAATPDRASADIVGITYDYAAGHNEVRRVDPTTGQTTLLSTFDFNTGFWNGVVMPDPALRRFYAESSDGTLYTFDADSGAIVRTAKLSTPMQSYGAVRAGVLIGITYNESTGHNEVRRVDPVTGATTLLNSFDFDTGFWYGPVLLDPQIDRLYAQSSAGTLYAFDAASGVVLSTAALQTQMQIIASMGSGALVGITFNEQTGHNEVHSIDPTSGQTVTLHSFDFDTGSWEGRIVTDPQVGRFYAQSSAGTLYTFDATSGAVLHTTMLDTPMQSFEALRSDAVVIFQCNTGVPNQSLPDGGTFDDAIQACAVSEEDGKQFKKCVKDLAKDWERAGLISKAQRTAIRQCADESNARVRPMDLPAQA